LQVQITIDDPKVYTKPWTVKQKVRLMPKADVIENACENNLESPTPWGKIQQVNIS